jgi:hypothetical protein
MISPTLVSRRIDWSVACDRKSPGEFKLITPKPSTKVINQRRITIIHRHTNYKLEKSRLGMQVQAALRGGGFALA